MIEKLKNVLNERKKDRTECTGYQFQEELYMVASKGYYLVFVTYSVRQNEASADST